MDHSQFNMHPEWEARLSGTATASTLARLSQFLADQTGLGRVIYPAPSQRLRAIQAYGPEQVRVVILGQDPYHGPGQAEGLSFSVPPGVRIPPSLRNIYKELAADVGFTPPPHGHLAYWAGQGVMLLNAVLTVEQAKPGAHQGKGWEIVTDWIIGAVAAQDRPVVFMLWGSCAQKKAAFVRDIADGGRHLVLRAPHPSPLSARHGFFGCRHFSKANAFLIANGQPPIDWQLPMQAD